MSNRQELQRMTGLLAVGEVGYINAINEFSREYKADPSILPTEWLDLSAKQTVAHFGGYLVAHKGFSAEIVYSHADAIAKKSNEIDLSADKQTISLKLTSLDAKVLEEETEEENNNKALGTYGEKKTKSLLAGVTDLKVEVLKGTHLTRKSKQELANLVEMANALLSMETVEPAPLGVKVAS